MITPITAKQRKRRFITYDLEWIPGSMELRLVGVYDGNRYRSYTSVFEFLSCELTHSNSGTWFYAHFGGMADFQFLLKWILDTKDPDLRVEASFSGASAIIVHIHKGKKTWHFVDSFWLFRDKLANIGKWIGLEKTGPSDPTLDMSDKDKKRWFAEVPLPELRKYNERDCVILWKAIQSFEAVLWELGSELQMTIASCGMRLFRRSYLTKPIHTNDLLNDYARQSYFASRVEVIKTHVKDALYYDINSSFPAAMTHPAPGDYRGALADIPSDENEIFLANCEVEVPENDYLPPLPWRARNRVFFPTGKWQAWITSVDLHLLLKRGGKISKVKEVHSFEPFFDLAEYVRDVYRRRMSADDPFNRQVYKYLLNCLYGKFAESVHKSTLLVNPAKSWFEENEEKILNGEIESYMPGCWIENRVVEIPHMHVPISTHITAIARKAIGNFMWDSLDKGAGVYYCDTDGFCTEATLPTGNELGEIKLEKKVENGRFVAPKIYHIKGQEMQKDGSWKQSEYIRAKGFSRLTADQFNRLCEGEAVTFERMGRIRERLQAVRASDGKMTFEVAEGKYTKRLRMGSPKDGEEWSASKHSIKKRVFDKTGNSRPWKRDEIAKLLRVT